MRKKTILSVLTLLLLILILAVVTFTKVSRKTIYKSAQKNYSSQSAPATKMTPTDFTTVWFTDFTGNRVVAVNREGHIVWEQHMNSAPIPAASQNVNAEFLTLAPNGDIMVTDADGMMVQEIDRASHKLLWQYGVRSQQYGPNRLHQPKKAFLMDNNEVLITDANNRRVIIVDKTTNKITWQYGHTTVMGDKPGFLKGNRFAMPIEAGKQFLVSDTLTNKIMIIDRATKDIVWQWVKPDAKWLQHVFPTADGTFVAEDHLKNDVFEVTKDGKILYDLHALADGTSLTYPTDVVKLGNGNLLISEGGKGRIIEIEPTTKKIVWEYKGAGLPTSIAVE